MTPGPPPSGVCSFTSCSGSVHSAACISTGFLLPEHRTTAPSTKPRSLSQCFAGHPSSEHVSGYQLAPFFSGECRGESMSVLTGAISRTQFLVGVGLRSLSSCCSQLRVVYSFCRPPPPPLDVGPLLHPYSSWCRQSCSCVLNVLSFVHLFPLTTRKSYLFVRMRVITLGSPGSSRILSHLRVQLLSDLCRWWCNIYKC